MFDLSNFMTWNTFSGIDSVGRLEGQIRVLQQGVRGFTPLENLKNHIL